MYNMDSALIKTFCWLGAVLGWFENPEKPGADEALTVMTEVPMTNMSLTKH
jgi:hypothetical protein